ncbi:amidohydrolase [Salix suchowensis]|nr:amidohydrolase [Salix suchowensis]
MLRSIFFPQMVLSCTSPCTQGISDQVVAAATARQANDELAATISNNTLRFGGFAALAMHDPVEAAQELKRTVEELGFLGALVNDYQQTNDSCGWTLLRKNLTGLPSAMIKFFDTAEFDPFWQVVTDLDVPVYFHPRSNIPLLSNLEFGHSSFFVDRRRSSPPRCRLTSWASALMESSSECASVEVQDKSRNNDNSRFPTLKIIVGHMGERIPSDFSRINDQLARQVVNGMPMQKKLSDYWRTNIFETTSGNFGTNLLRFHIGQIGLDRILYSVDYPFVTIEQGTEFINTLAETTSLSEEDIVALKRGTAIKLLKLDQ